MKLIEALGFYLASWLESAANSKRRLKEAKTEAIITQDANSSANRGIKDYLLLGITAFPFILAFMPDHAQTVTEGFQALQTVPNYYWYGLIIVYVDTFGLRQLIIDEWTKRRGNK